MKHGSLFSGIGGFDLAAEWMGWENVFHCEIEEYKRIELKKNFPNSKSYDDIAITDFSIYRGKIDILTGGFPCQDASIAKQDGKGQQGIQGERTGLVWHMFRAIEEIAPPLLLPKTSPIFLKLIMEMICLPSYVNFPEWGTMQNGELYMHQMQVPPISVKGCISLLTPTASECNRDRLSFPMYTKRHHRSPGGLSEQLYRLVGAEPGRVNPQFYAWMMGYPLNWLGNPYTATETQ